MHMLTIICGDDTATSRRVFSDLKQRYTANNYEVVASSSHNLEELFHELSFSSTLFSSKRAFFLENVLSKKAQRDQITALIAVTGKSTPEVVIWEEATDERTLKKSFPTAKILVSKLSQTLWKFLDGLYPGNLSQTLATLREIKDTTDIHITHFMLMRRMKELLLVTNGSQPAKAASWQVGKLKQQARQWNPEKLESFFKKLIEIEMQTKNGTMIYSLDRALEIALCFYL